MANQFRKALEEGKVLMEQYLAKLDEERSALRKNADNTVEMVDKALAELENGNTDYVKTVLELIKKNAPINVRLHIDCIDELQEAKIEGVKAIEKEFRISAELEEKNLKVVAVPA